MAKKKSSKKRTKKSAERPLEDIAVEMRDRIIHLAGKDEGLRYMQQANGIIVFFPKELRSVVVRGYGMVMASWGKDLADFYL